jgi:hypothetical protein
MEADIFSALMKNQPCDVGPTPKSPIGDLGVKTNNRHKLNECKNLSFLATQFRQRKKPPLLRGDRANQFPLQISRSPH